MELSSQRAEVIERAALSSSGGELRIECRIRILRWIATVGWPGTNNSVGIALGACIG